MSKVTDKKIFIASDHAGYDLKSKICTFLTNQKIEVLDLGTESPLESVDYPDFAKKLTKELSKDSSAVGILICGSGIGISIAANREKYIRAALCINEEMARLSRIHNDANVLCLGARLIDESDALNAVNMFLNTEFEKGRHVTRVQKLS